MHSERVRQSLLLLPINKNVYVSPISVVKCALCLWSKLKGKKSSQLRVCRLWPRGIPGSQHLSAFWSALRSERGGWFLSRAWWPCGSAQHSAVSGPSPTSYFPQCSSQSAGDKGQNILHYKQSLSEHVIFTMTKQDTAGKSSIWQGSSVFLGAEEMGAEHTGTQLLTNS